MPNSIHHHTYGHINIHDCFNFATEAQQSNSCEEINARKNEIIINGGDELRHIYIIKTGYVRSYRINQEGQLTIIGLHYPGEIIGNELLINESSDYFASSVGKSILYKVPVDMFLQSRHSPKLLSLKLLELQDLLNIFSKLNATEKICWFMLRHSLNQNRRGYITSSFEFGFTRNDIANYIGITSETMSRIINKLKLDQAIAIKGKFITILDFSKLIDNLPFGLVQQLKSFEAISSSCPLCQKNEHLPDNKLVAQAS